VNAAVQAGPAANSAPAVNPLQSVADMAAGAVGANLPEGGFRELLDRHLQSDSTALEAASEQALAAVGTAGEPGVPVQIIDSARVAAEAMEAFLASQPPVAAMSAPAGGATPIDESLHQAVRSRPPGSGLPVGEAAVVGLPSRAAEAAAEPVASEEPRAAMSAAPGKGLPQPAADRATSAFRPVTVEAAAAARPGDAGQPQPQAQPAAGAVPEFAGALPSAAPGPAGPAAGAEVRVASTQVATPFGRPEWPHAMNERVTWLVGQRMQSADIQLNPAQLGPVEVRITVRNDEATLLFNAHSGAVREAIQAALPRLGEMLAQGGLSLGQVSVGAESFAGQQQSMRDGHGHGNGNGNGNGNARRPDGERAPVTLAGQAVAGQGGTALLRVRPGIDTFV
jgi:flagellar hook-length control protein FliK